MEGFGIDAPVDILPVGTTTVTISRNYKNNGRTAAAGGYQVTEKVERLVFQAAGASAGWSAGSDPGLTVTDQSAQTVALAPGSTGTATFTFAVTGCGLYRETLTVNGITATHFFFVPSNMAVNIELVPNDVVEVRHDVVNRVTHTFNVRGGTPVTQYNVFGRAQVLGSQNSVGNLAPAPMGRGQTFGPGSPSPPFVFRVTGNPHRAPITNILREVHEETLEITVTAITTDGCNIRQQKARVTVVHPGS